MFTEYWANVIAKRLGMKFSESNNSTFILLGLNYTKGKCPCVSPFNRTKDHHNCPCKEARENKNCKCGLFEV